MQKPKLVEIGINNQCELCKRTFCSNEGRFPVSDRTRHHITPKIYHKRNNYELEFMDVCDACQKQIHRMFANKELKKMTKEELQNHPKIITWIKWIRKE